MHPTLEKTFSIIETYGRVLGLTVCPSTCRTASGQLKRFYRHLLIAGKDYASITTADIELYISVQEWKHVSKANFVLTLKRFYKYLQDKRLVDNNPAEILNVPFLPQHSLPAMAQVGKLRRVLRKLEQDTTPAGLINRLLVELAYGSGLRRMELVTLDIEDINLTERTVRVLGKGRKQRVVPLSRRCLAVLEHYLPTIPAGQRPLFSLDNGKRMTAGQVGAAIKKSTGLNAHFFRHACAQHMLLAGCNIRHIQELLGHEQIGTTQIYTRFDKRDLRRIINKKHPGRRRSVAE